MSTTSNHFYIDIKLKNKTVVGASESTISINVDNIEYLTIKENVLSVLPRLELVINDVGSLIENVALYDKDILNIMISNDRSQDALLSMDFNVSVFASQQSPDDNKYSIIKIVGYLAVDDCMSTFKSRSFNKNSAEVLEMISDEIGVEFSNPNSISPSDKMIWYQSCTNYKFIKHILKRSYVDSDSVFFYGNSKNNLVYTTMTSEMDKEKAFIAKYDRTRVDNFLLTDAEKDIMYFDSSDIVNLSEIYNNINNYGILYSFYDMKGGENSAIITNGNPFTDLKNRSTDYDGKPVINDIVGTISNPNVFDNYNTAMLQNYYYKYNLFSVSVSLNINASTDVKLFDKVNLALPSTYQRDQINDVYSGYYLVTAMTHNVTAGGQYSKQIILSRWGMNKTDNIKEYGVN